MIKFNIDTVSEWTFYGVVTSVVLFIMFCGINVIVAPGLPIACHVSQSQITAFGPEYTIVANIPWGTDNHRGKFKSIQEAQDAIPSTCADMVSQSTAINLDLISQDAGDQKQQ